MRQPHVVPIGPFPEQALRRQGAGDDRRAAPIRGRGPTRRRAARTPPGGGALRRPGASVRTSMCMSAGGVRRITSSPSIQTSRRSSPAPCKSSTPDSGTYQNPCQRTLKNRRGSVGSSSRKSSAISGASSSTSGVPAKPSCEWKLAVQAGQLRRAGALDRQKHGRSERRHGVTAGHGAQTTPGEFHAEERCHGCPALSVPSPRRSGGGARPRTPPFGRGATAPERTASGSRGQWATCGTLRAP